MKNKIYYLLIAFLVITSINSCSIHKRKFNKGFYVNWHNNKINEQDKISLNSEENIVQQEQELKVNPSVELEETQLEEIVSSSYTPTNDISTSNSNELNFIANKTVESEILTANLFNKNKEIHHHKRYQKWKKQKASVDGELVLNIVLLLLFLGLSILFLSLALNATGVLVYVYYGASLVSFIFFITQILDIIYS